MFNGRQQYVADKMAQLLIRESSDLDGSTSDDFELERENLDDVEQHARKIFLSNNVVDRRLVRVYQSKRWAEDYKAHKSLASAFSRIVDEQESLYFGRRCSVLISGSKNPVFSM